MIYDKLALKTLSLFIISNIFALIFMFIVHNTSNDHLNGIDKQSNYFRYLYFSLTTTTSVGYGDIYPISPLGKSLCILQQFIILLNLELDFLELFRIKFE